MVLPFVAHSAMEDANVPVSSARDRSHPALGRAAGVTLGAAQILDVHKSTALRILQTLQAERFVRKTGAGTYVFGSGLIELSELTLG